MNVTRNCNIHFYGDVSEVVSLLSPSHTTGQFSTELWLTTASLFIFTSINFYTVPMVDHFVLIISQVSYFSKQMKLKDVYFLGAIYFLLLFIFVSKNKHVYSIFVVELVTIQSTKRCLWAN